MSRFEDASSRTEADAAEHERWRGREQDTTLPPHPSEYEEN